MNVKSFIGRNTRDAMAKVRLALGGEAIVLKNRSVPGGVEILAMADVPDAQFDAASAGSAAPAGAGSTTAPAGARGEPDKPMSTLTFQQFVRDRLVRRQADPLAGEHDESPAGGRADACGERERAAPQPAQRLRAKPADSLDDSVRRARETPPTLTQVLQPEVRTAASEVMDELRAMRGLIASQLSSMAWFDGVCRNPLQVKFLRRLIGCGFSNRLARKLIARMPSDFSEADAERWLRDALARLIAFDAPGSTLVDRGGIYALVGPTGVGKTTTAAKIAAQFALRHGVQSVGLLTVDAYRIGAQDQLRTFGRLLGVPVHVAHDAGTLAEFLHLFMNKKLVLIDTVGVGQRDQRLSELMASLSSTRINKLLVLNAAAQPETLEDVITAYRADTATSAVISKVDEAVKTAGVLDCLIRHRLRLVGVADGQRVPEDWQLPDPSALVAAALTERASAAFDLDDNDLSLLLAPMGAAGTPRLDGAAEAHHHV